MLSNTTIADIVNEIQGVDDLVDEDDEDIDWIRHMYRENLNDLVLAKKSDELKADYRDSIIVLFRNESTEAEENAYSVVRYKKHYTGWIKEYHAFDFISDDVIDDFFLFDEFALYLTKDRTNFKAVFFDDIDYDDDVLA